MTSFLDGTAGLAALSPRGTSLARVDDDGRLRLHDLRPGRSGTTEIDVIGPVTAVAVSDSGAVAVGTEGGEILTAPGDILATGGRRHGRPAGSLTAAIRAVAIALNGRVVALDGRGAAAVHDGGGTLRLTVPSCTAIAISPDGARVALGDPQRTTVLQVDGPRAHELWAAEAPDAVVALAFSSDGARLAAAGETALQTWWAGAGESTGGLVGLGNDGHRPPLAISVAGRVAAGSARGTVVLAVVDDPDVGFRAVARHSSPVRALAFTGDAGDGGTVVSVSADGGRRTTPVTTPAPASGPVTAIAVSPDGTLVLSADRDGTVRRHDPATAAVLDRARGGHEGAVLAVAAVAIDSLACTGGEDGRINEWPYTVPSSGDPYPPTPHGAPVGAVAMSADGRIVASGDDDGAVWVTGPEDADEDPLGTLVVQHPDPVAALVVSPDGARLVSVDEGGDVRVVDHQASPRGDRTFVVGPRPSAVVVSGDTTRLVAGGEDGRVRQWDVVTGRRLGRDLDGHPGAVVAVAVTPAGDRAVSVSRGGALRVWDMDAAVQARGLVAPGDVEVTALAILPDGSAALAGGADGVVRLVELPPGSRAAERSAEVRSDAAATEDALGWADDTTTMAALLAATATVAPLSVALMGNWGSGKSTFMGLVQRRVDELAGSGPAYVGDVHQVRFNAWHYSDDHLWVGLVEHLFRSLRDDRAPVVVDHGRKVAKEARLGEARARRAHLDRALTEIDELAIDRGWWGRLLQVRRSWLVVRTAGGAAARRLDRRLVLPTVLTLVAVGLVAVVVVGNGLLSGWVGRIGWLAPALLLAGAVRTAVTRTWGTVADSTTALRETLIADRDRYAADVAGLERELTELDPARRLDDLIHELAADDRYAGHRGLTGRVHHDLQRLSDLLVRADEGHRPALRRIVLYVDDLDRCVSARVVEVLQALNLLLTMPLFLVVVAVDPRWLLRALDEHHGALLNARPEARTGRPLDYLDKIFHVPFAVRPMHGHAETYLRDLLPPVRVDAAPVEPAGPDETAGAVRTGEGGGPVPAVPAAPRGPAAPAVGTMPPGSTATVGYPQQTYPQQADPAADASRAVADPPPRPEPVTRLELSAEEADFVPRLADLVPTPRGVKKLANLYRLLRNGIPEREIPAFLGDPAQGGPYQAAAILLATLITAPGEARDLLQGLQTAPPAAEADVTDRLRALAVTVPVAETIADLVGTARAGGLPVHGDPATYARWAGTVARYSFDTYDLFTAEDRRRPPHTPQASTPVTEPG